MHHDRSNSYRFGYMLGMMEFVPRRNGCREWRISVDHLVFLQVFLCRMQFVDPFGDLGFGSRHADPGSGNSSLDPLIHDFSDPVCCVDESVSRKRERGGREGERNEMNERIN